MLLIGDRSVGSAKRHITFTDSYFASLQVKEEDQVPFDFKQQ